MGVGESQGTEVLRIRVSQALMAHTNHTAVLFTQAEEIHAVCEL